MTSKEKAKEMFPIVDNMEAMCKGVQDKLVDMANWKDEQIKKLKEPWEKEAEVNHNDKLNYEQGWRDALEKAWEIYEKDATYIHPRKGCEVCKRTKAQFLDAINKGE